MFFFSTVFPPLIFPRLVKGGCYCGDVMGRGAYRTFYPPPFPIRNRRCHSGKKAITGEGRWKNDDSNFLSERLPSLECWFFQYIPLPFPISFCSNANPPFFSLRSFNASFQTIIGAILTFGESKADLARFQTKWRHNSVTIFLYDSIPFIKV